MEISSMESHTEDKYRFRVLDVLWMVVKLLVSLCAIPFFLAAQWWDEFKLKYRQRRAVKGLSVQQRDLLCRLWDGDKRLLKYQNAYQQGYVDLKRVRDAADKQVQVLLEKCRQADIEEWRISAFSIDENDFQ